MAKKKSSKKKNAQKQAIKPQKDEKILTDGSLRSEAENAETVKTADTKAENTAATTKTTENNTASEKTETAKSSAEKSETSDTAENTATVTSETDETGPDIKTRTEISAKDAKSSAEKTVKIKENKKTADKKQATLNLWQKIKELLSKALSEKERKRERGVPPVAVALILPFLIFLFGLYYIGIIDIAFIERPATWENNLDRFFSIGKETEPETFTPETLPFENNTTLEEPIETVPSLDLSGTFNPNREEQKINSATVFKTDDQLTSEGYYITDGTYDANTCEVGKMTYNFTLPRKFAYRNMTARDWVITTYDDGRMSTVEDTEVTAPRPAVYPYMGYIIFDDARRGLYLMDYTGNILMNYNENYIPAFARTPDGKPLFYSTYRYLAETPVSVETNEAGEEVVTGTKNVYLTGRNYFTLSASGTYFVKTDYVEEKDGRGLNFDFEDSYGLADTTIKRVGVMSPKITTFLDGKSALVNFMNWNFFLENDPNIPVLEDIIAKENAYNALPLEEKLKLIEAKQTPFDLYGLDTRLPYSAAYNYNGGYAVVMTDDTGEEPKYETKELRVINTYGEVQFVSKKNYYNTELKDYCSDRFLPPLSKGEDSIGHFYFDHGLLRLRKVSFDQYQLDEWGVLRINMDRDVLVYPNGREFPIPDGFILKGYSDGIMLLERNGLYGYMDYTGRWIASPEFETAKPFYSGVGVVCKNGVWGALDVNGNNVLPFKFSYISNRSDGIIAAFSETAGWEIYGIFTK